MIAAFLRFSRPAAAGLACLAAASGEVMEFRDAVGSTVPSAAVGTARFLSVEALSETSPAEPARAFAGGYFTGIFEFGTIAPLLATFGEDGVLTGRTRLPTGIWNHDWHLQAESLGGDARITDVALAADGTVFVTGTFTVNVLFERPLPDLDISFSTGAGLTDGFVAWADPDTGQWLDAFQVFSMEPRSLAVGNNGRIFLTGTPILAREYDPGGTEQWSEPQPAGTESLNHIALGPTPEGLRVFVTGSIDNGTAPNFDVFLARIEPGQLAGPVPPVVDWIRQVTGPGAENPGGLGVGPLGDLRLAFSSNDQVLDYDGTLLPLPPLLAGRHAHVLNLSPGGVLIWNALLGQLNQPGGQMDCSDLAVDPFGNVHVAASFNGDFVFEGVLITGDQDAAVISLEATGAQYNFAPSTGTALELGLGVAAPNFTLQVLVGGYTGPANSSKFGTITLPAAPNNRAYMAILEPAPVQEAYFVTGGQPVSFILEQLNEVGAQVYRVVDRPGQGVRFVAAYVTDEQENDLSIFALNVDYWLDRDGVEDPSGWALAHLNDASGSSTTYTYPETCREVVLYLIDTAVDNSSGYFDGNTNLTLGSTILVRGTGDPLASSSFDHGTRMLSMIAGPDHGVAQGTPVKVVNYDIFATPGNLSTRLSALTEAVTLANTHKLTNHPFDPATYCIASSATDISSTEPNLAPAVAYTVGSSVRSSVILSAGNTSGKAEDYTPSYLGEDYAGVITAGAIDSSNAQVTISGGSTIDTRGEDGVEIWAPGDAVPAADTSGNGTTVTGTSASAALTAGAALVYLSGNPFATASTLETALVTTFSQSDTIGDILSVPDTGVPWFTTFADWGSWYLLSDATTSGNDDGDQWSNEEEYIWGFDPTSFDTEPLVGVSLSGSTLTVDFPLACYLYHPDVPTTHTLQDSSSLKIMRSTNLSTWTDITNTLTITEGATSNGQISLSFDYSVSSSPCFFQVQVEP